MTLMLATLGLPAACRSGSDLLVIRVGLHVIGRVIEPAVGEQDRPRRFILITSPASGISSTRMIRASGWSSSR